MNGISADSLKSNFDALSFDEQKRLVDTLLSCSTPRLLSYLQEKLLQISYRDFLSLLPQELIDHLLSFVDAQSLLQCCQVSCSWRSIVDGNGKAWHRACKNLGMEPEAVEWCKSPAYWKNFYLKWAQLFDDMLHGRAFQSMLYGGHENHITAVYYWNGKIATGSDDKAVRIWDCAINDYERTIVTNCSISCIKFDSSIVLISSYSGCLKSFQFTSGEPIQVYTSHIGAVFSMDFRSDLNLLVSGGADEKVMLWALKGGQRIKTLRGHMHWVVQVSIIHHKTISDAYYLLSMDKNEIRVWPLPETQDYADIQCSQCIPIGISNFNFFTPGLHSDGRLIYYVKQDPRPGGYTLLCCWDIVEKKLIGEQEMRMAVKLLLAVGEKYVCLVTPWVDSGTPNFLVASVKDLQIVAQWHCPPSSPTTPCNSQMCIGDKKWLDGLTGTNNSGFIMVAGTHKSLLYVLKWKNDTSMQHLDCT